MDQILAQILTELQGLREGQSQQGEDLASLKKDVSSLKTDVSSLKKDVSSLKTDVSSLKTDVGEIKTALRFVWEDIKKIDSRLTAQGDELVLIKRLK